MSSLTNYPLNENDVVVGLRLSYVHIPCYAIVVNTSTQNHWNIATILACKKNTGEHLAVIHTIYYTYNNVVVFEVIKKSYTHLLVTKPISFTNSQRS